MIHISLAQERVRRERRLVRCNLRYRALALSVLMTGLASACLDPPVGAGQPVTTNLFTARISQDRVERIDLLFMIDNSSSMSDKQRILQTAVPDLVDRLVNPICLDADGHQYPAAAPGQPCPDGQHREFRPVSDINIGIVSSSLGDAGSGISCADGDTVDDGHLIGSLSRAKGVQSNQWGFINWQDGTDPASFKADFQALVQSVGEHGCGFEASLEAWYRFLIDPVPYASLGKAPCSPGSRALCTAPALGADGQPLIDDTLLAQRAAFLRPDSLVAIVVLSDENDCSLQAGGQAWLATTSGRNVAPMFAASAACADDPTSNCCYSCPAGPPPGCEWADAPCQADSSHLEDRLPAAADAINLRCFEQKRRFGIDFLYPTQRYVNALSRYQLCLTNPTLDPEGCTSPVVDNPLYAGGRPRESVYLAGIVGVPWQDIAASAAADGGALPADTLRFKTAAELASSDWARILGNPEASPPQPAGDPLMDESTARRAGVAPGGANGREYATDPTTPGTPDDLQYACIFPLTEPRSCAGTNDSSCDCAEQRDDQPLCEQHPGVDAPTTTQYWAKAYPGLRELEVLKGFGDNSIVASICARNVTDLAKPDFGYRPAIASIVDRLGEQLARRCLPRPLDVRADGSVPCT
ncbi:MAG TPA: hypothetical protein VG963_29935, partial [Polyangiaceae bacterium]|nr:hypothetical protein [Polyangiaceae bacterium]